MIYRTRLSWEYVCNYTRPGQNQFRSICQNKTYGSWTWLRKLGSCETCSSSLPLFGATELDFWLGSRRSATALLHISAMPIHVYMSTTYCTIHGGSWAQPVILLPLAISLETDFPHLSSFQDYLKFRETPATTL